MIEPSPAGVRNPHATAPSYTYSSSLVLPRPTLSKLIDGIRAIIVFIRRAVAMSLTRKRGISTAFAPADTQYARYATWLPQDLRCRNGRDGQQSMASPYRLLYCNLVYNNLLVIYSFSCIFLNIPVCLN